MHPIHQSFHTSLFNPSSASILYLQVVSKQLCALFPGSVQCFDNAIRLFIVLPFNLKHYIEKKKSNNLLQHPMHGKLQDFCDVKFRKCLYKVCGGENHKKYLDNKKCKLKVLWAWVTGCPTFLTRPVHITYISEVIFENFYFIYKKKM